MGGFGDYDAKDALGLAAAVRHGETTPSDLLEAALERADRLNPSLNAIVIPATEAARRALEQGLPDGPFRGVPFLLKDLYATWEGSRLTNGSRLYEDYVCDHDSELVARHRRAGLVIFGRTASPEFGITTSTESVLFGATHNPWKRGFSAGGSSGGAAAAVAGGILPLAHASDGGGSIRIPASCCGLFGLKPTRARQPAGPDVGEGWSGMSIQHAVSRSVRDSAALLDATAGPDLGAPYYAPPPARPFAEEVGADPGRLRIAVQTAPFNGCALHPDCMAAAEDAAALCEQLGHQVEEARVEIDAEAFGRTAQVVIAANVRAALVERAAELGREPKEDDVEPGTWLMAEAGRGMDAAAYASAIRGIHDVGRRVARFHERYHVLLTPTMATPPVEHGLLALTNPDTASLMGTLMSTIGFTQVFNASGTPAMSVPLHWNADGLPVGVQFAARFGDEATLFRLAAQLEAARPWFDRRPSPLGAA